MMRSFAVALVTIAAVAVLGSSERLAANAQQKPIASYSYPVDIVGGTAGVNVEIFLNNGKVGDTTVGAGGDAKWVLDLSNVGKTRVTVYVDVCKDGKIVKVAFVTGNGAAPPQDDGCNRRIGGAGWMSDCLTRFTINFLTWGAQGYGCTAVYQKPWFYGVVGGLVALPLALGGDDNGPAPSGNVPQPPTVTLPPSLPPQTPINSTPPNPPPSTPPAQPTADSFNGQYTGNLTVTENVCRFTSTAGFTARLNVNNSGTGTLEFTYVSTGQQQLYVFTSVRVTMNGSQGSFEAQTDSAQFGYRLIVQGRLSGNAFTGNISFFDSRPGNCHTGYVVNGTRQ